jgi:hypothetical protein
VSSTLPFFRCVRRVALCIAASAAPATAQQLEGAWSWTWHHVAPGTTTPITPQVPGVVSPGEAVEFRGSFSFTGMGTVLPGSATNLPGPVVGFGRTFSSFHSLTPAGGQFYEPVFRGLPLGPAPTAYAQSVGIITVGQFLPHGQPITFPGSNFPDVLRIRWNPISYEARLASFEHRYILPSSGGPAHAIIMYDQQQLLYDSVPLPVTSWGSVQVPIVPAPSGAAAFMAAALFASRRRRRRLGM